MIVKLFEYLQEKEIDVYFVGQHKGECKKPYVVLKDDGTNSLNGKTGTSLIDVLFFIPENKFTRCESYKNDVKRLINQFGKIRYTGIETGIVVDDQKKALTFSVMYQCLKKLGE